MNSALEDDHRTEHQFQYERPPVADTANNTHSQKLSREDVQQQALYTQNETAIPPATSIQTPLEQRTNETPSSTEAPIVIERSNIRDVVPEDIKPPVQVPTNEQPSKDRIHQKVIKEDVLLVHTETVSTTQSHQQEETLYLSKTVTEQIPVPSDQQQQTPISNSLDNEVSADQLHEQLEPEATKSNHLADSQVEQLKLVDNVRKTSSADVESNQQLPTFDATEASRSADLHLEPLQVPEVELTNTLDDFKQPKPATETVQSIDSADLDTPVDQPTPVVETPKLAETKETVTTTEKPASVGRKVPATARVIRPPTSRIQQKAQARQRHAHVKSPPQPQSAPNTGKILSSLADWLIFSCLDTVTGSPTQESIEPSVTIPKSDEMQDETVQQPTIDVNPNNETEINNTVEQPIEPSVTILKSEETQAETVQQPIIDVNSNNETETNNLFEQPIEPSMTILKPEEPLAETAQQPPSDVDLDNQTDTNNIDEQPIEPLTTIDLPRQVHVHDPTIVENELKEEIHRNENGNPSQDQQIENNVSPDSFLANEHSPHLPRILENEQTISSIDSTVTTTPQTIETSTDSILNSSPAESKVIVTQRVVLID